jgi:hypothetical protein
MRATSVVLHNERYEKGPAVGRRALAPAIHSARRGLAGVESAGYQVDGGLVALGGRALGEGGGLSQRKRPPGGGLV